MNGLLDNCGYIEKKIKVVVGFSGGVTSAWCAGWAIREYGIDKVILLFHDTKEEHEDTYRFIKEMASALGLPITERSDGRSVTQLFYDENYLGNGQNTFCSRMLKAEPGQRYIAELKSQGFSVLKILGFSAKEPKRIQRACGYALRDGFSIRFPVAESGITKQDCVDWCENLGVKPSSMYCWSEHANCVGCVKGGRAYWLQVAEHAPEVFEARARQEEEFGHEIIRGSDREHVTLRELVQIGLKRKVNSRESITLGSCECGD